MDCTPEAFVEKVHRCPVKGCGAISKRVILAAGVRSGVVVPGTRVPYPIRDFQLPVPSDGSYRGGGVVVESYREHKEKAHVAGFDLNQI